MRLEGAPGRSLKLNVPWTLVHAVLESAPEVATVPNAPLVAQSAVFVDMVAVGLVLSGAASNT